MNQQNFYSEDGTLDGLVNDDTIEEEGVMEETQEESGELVEPPEFFE